MTPDFLAGIERLAAVEALKTSFVVYPLVNALHILSIGTLVGAILVMDLRLLGVGRDVAAAPLLRLLRRVIGVAFALAVLSGLALFSIRASEYAANPAFRAKLALLALAGLNFAAFHVLARGTDPSAPPPAARAMAVLSIGLWVSVLVAGRFIGFV